MDAWFTTDPATGALVRVLRADLVDEARRERSDAMAHADVMREAAARLKVIARAAVTEGGKAGDKARVDLREGLDWLAQGAPALASSDDAPALALSEEEK